jgi:hypothetical protein
MLLLSLLGLAIAIVLLSCRYGPFCSCKSKKDGHKEWYEEMTAAKAYVAAIDRESPRQWDG